VDQAETEALADLCEGLPALREECLLEPEEVRGLLARIEEEARERRPVRALLRELTGVDPTSTRGVGNGLPGFGPGRAQEVRFACPDGACDRVGLPVPAGPPPRCHVTGVPMKRR
jgi:hypothetical protein